jgi:hypothetical protein
MEDVVALLSLRRFQVEEPRESLNLRACQFERTVLNGGLREGGVLTCLCQDGREWSLRVAMTWDALASLRAELVRHGVLACDDVIIRSVLRNWGVKEFSRRLSNGGVLPSQELVLGSLGGPASSLPRRLLQASGLLPGEAA